MICLPLKIWFAKEFENRRCIVKICNGEILKQLHGEILIKCSEVGARDHGI